MDNLVTINNLSVVFNKDKKIIDNISFDIPKGKTVALVGESGSGKTITALSILKLLPSAATNTDGEIIYNNKNLLANTDQQMQKIRGKNLTTIFQEPMLSLNPLHTIDRQIEEIITTHSNSSTKSARLKTLELLKEVGLEEIAKRPNIYSYELSGGQRQRVMIAMSIANNPDLLIADEPTTALDVSVQIQILELLKKLQKKLNMSILFISHDLSVVKHMADFICVMKEGKIIEQNTKDEVFNNPIHNYTKELINSQNKKRENEFIKNSILNVENLKVWYPIKKGILKKTVDHVKAINNLSFNLNKKETIGIVGESGSGKTSLVLAILKLINSEGKIKINNLELSNLKQKEFKKLRKDIQIVFQDPFSSLSPRMNVEEIISEGLNIHYPNLSRNEKKIKLINTLEKVGLNYIECIEKYPHEFSGGQRQRIAIARALILDPKILILDEPTSALDVTIQNQIIDLLNELQTKLSLSYIFISHDMKVIKSIADKIIVLKNGFVVEENNTMELFKNPKSDYTNNLIRSVL